MDLKGAVMQLSRDTGLTYAAASRILGHKDAYVSSAVGRGKCPSFDNANLIVRAFGYSICLVKQGDEPKLSIVVDETMDGVSFTAKSKEAAARKERERRRKALQAELDRLNEMDSE